MKTKKDQAWIISINMGYGHQRTAYPLMDLAPEEKIINVNDYKGIPRKDKSLWESSREFYEFISRFKRVPIVGEVAFSIFNKFQEIPVYYPKRDLSNPTLGLRKIFKLIKKGWGQDFVLKLKKKKLPIISTFFIPAFMAEHFKYPEEIYCTVCDADISRAWAPLEPGKTRIKYFASNSWTANRLSQYGIKEKNIILTGYPLPLENIGARNQNVLKEDIRLRLFNLDPENVYRKYYNPLVQKYVGDLPKKSNRVLTILFSIGGAGAQTEIVSKYLKSLSLKIKSKEIRIFLGAGVKERVKDRFLAIIKDLGLNDNLDDNIEIIFNTDINNYFKDFSSKIRETDILWTKPSELSFYTGLGVPIIIAPPVGSQEDFNKRWLLSMGCGVLQEDPKYAHEWIFDYLNSGRFAEAALDGYIQVESLATYKIKKAVFGKQS